MKLVLTRTYFRKGTNGALSFKGEPICATIELPWKNNERRISCIPEGTYKLAKRYSRKFGHHYWVTGVNKRELILIHPANDALEELKGCIAPVSLITGQGKGIHSKVALEKIQQVINRNSTVGETLLLEITSVDI